MTEFYVGIDLGGTNIKAGVVDSEAKVISKLSIPTEGDRRPNFPSWSRMRCVHGHPELKCLPSVGHFQYMGREICSSHYEVSPIWAKLERIRLPERPSSDPN